jgi:hypothetical protein
MIGHVNFPSKNVIPVAILDRDHAADNPMPEIGDQVRIG